ncbi:hypothetical protein V8D89_002038 [Ganoderma adspersum]
MYPIYIPSLSSPDVLQSSSSPASESAKIHLQETPSLRVQGLKQCLHMTEAKLEVCLAAETTHKASRMQYARDLEAWEHRAANMEISQVQMQFRELSVKFEAVQLELLTEKDMAKTFQADLHCERDTATAKCEKEMLALD